MFHHHHRLYKPRYRFHRRIYTKSFRFREINNFNYLKPGHFSDVNGYERLFNKFVISRILRLEEKELDINVFLYLGIEIQNVILIFGIGVTLIIYIILK